MRFRESKEVVQDLNISPLIDMVFILLIFFMVSTTFVKDMKLEFSTGTGKARGDSLKISPPSPCLLKQLREAVFSSFLQFPLPAALLCAERSLSQNRSSSAKIVKTKSSLMASLQQFRSEVDLRSLKNSSSADSHSTLTKVISFAA